MAYRLHKLGQYLRGWTAYFGISQYYRPVPELIEQDQAAHTHVLQETVALGAHQDQESAGFGLRTAAPIPPARNWTVRRGGAMRRRGLQG